MSSTTQLLVTEPHITIQRPTADEHLRFLISFHFGGELYPGLAGCVGRAYLDLSRTAHGIGESSNAPELKRSAHNLVESLLGEAIQQVRPWQADAFDAWHRASCQRICSHYANGGYHTFRTGQAQKWVNMTFKYALGLAVLGMLDIKHIEALRLVAHVPLDNYILSAFASFDPPSLPRAWSRIADYSRYLEFQRWIRITFPENAPLDVEFRLWIKENTRRRAGVSA